MEQDGAYLTYDQAWVTRGRYMAGIKGGKCYCSNPPLVTPPRAGFLLTVAALFFSPPPSFYASPAHTQTVRRFSLSAFPSLSIFFSSPSTLYMCSLTVDPSGYCGCITSSKYLMIYNRLFFFLCFFLSFLPLSV